MNKYVHLALFSGALAASVVAASGCTTTTIIEQTEPAPPAVSPEGGTGAEAGGGQKVAGPSGKLFGQTVTSYATLGAAGEVLTAGVVFPLSSFSSAPPNGPFQDELVLAMPDAVVAQTFLSHMRVNWLATGHSPTAYNVPHFDFHIFRGTVSEVDAIECRADKRLPPADQVPPGYTLEPQLCFSGFHAWPEADLSGSSWTGSIILGYFANKMVFIEPMIPKSTFDAKKDFDLPIGKPKTAGGTKTLYPTKLAAKYDATADAYTFEFSAFESVD